MLFPTQNTIREERVYFSEKKVHLTQDKKTSISRYFPNRLVRVSVCIIYVIAKCFVRLNINEFPLDLVSRTIDTLSDIVRRGKLLIR